MKEKACEECKFFETGFCKRFPPTFTGPRTQFPSVQSYDWCGEFDRALVVNERRLRFSMDEAA